MDVEPQLDADGLPLFPPLPARRPFPTGARSLPRLLVSLNTGVVSVRTGTVAAMVVFLDHEPIDGLALRGDRRVAGPDALDEIADAPIDRVEVTEIEPPLARVLGVYFLPTELRDVPARFFAPEDFVLSLARPGQRGCVLITGGAELGLAFVAGGRVAMAYRQDGIVGGIEMVAPLFAAPEARVWAKLGPEPVPRSERVPVSSSAVVDAVLQEMRQVLGPHAVRVEGVIREARPTAEGLRSAAESIRERRVRLLSPASMDLAADRALAVLERHGSASPAG